MCLYDMAEEYKWSVDKYQSIISIAIKPLLLSKNYCVAVDLFKLVIFSSAWQKY